MRGYKIFGPNYTCKYYKYSLDTTNVYNVEVLELHNGLHFCPRAVDCLSYYNYVPCRSRM